MVIKVSPINLLLDSPRFKDDKVKIKAFILLFSGLQLRYMTKSMIFPYGREVAASLLATCKKLRCFSIEDNLSTELKEYLCCVEQALQEIEAAGMYSWTVHKNIEIASMAICGLENSQEYQKDYPPMYPKTIHLETYALCNAKCNFCDYQDLERKGIKMPDELVDKVLGELACIPKNHSFQVQPYKISEPFLDERLPDIAKKIINCHPRSKISIISNGNFMPIHSIEALSVLSWDCIDMTQINSKKMVESRIRFTFSLNEVDPKKYSDLMKLNLSVTLKNLRTLHKLVSTKKIFPFSISLTRVSSCPSGDKEFLKFCRDEFPLFKSSLVKMNNWATSNIYAKDVLNYEPLKSFSSQSCSRWSDLSILANGDVALCCMDSGQLGLKLGSVIVSNSIELYQKKNKKYVPSNLKRKSSEFPCSACTYYQGLGSINLYKELEKQALADQII